MQNYKHKISLTEDELESIFSYKKNMKKKSVWDPIRIFGIFLFFSAVIFIVININAVKNKLDYWYQNDFTDSPTTNNITAPNISQQVTSTSEIKKVVLPKIDNNHVKIEAIGLDAPISWRVKNDTTDVAAALKSGVIHIDGTALPGEKGNIFITGHSSNYVWAKGDYNSVFANINKLVSGDFILIKYQEKNYLYAVVDQKVVSATDVSVLEDGNGYDLTLMTCWPLGTAYKRLIVSAKQIYPNPDANANQTNKIRLQKLPAAR